MKPAGGALLLAGVTIVVAAAVVAGFFALGSPGEERVRQLDEKRIEDLKDIASAVEMRYSPKRGQSLPESLGVQGVLRQLNRSRRDPLTGTPYGYRILSPNSFELCATFQAETQRDESDERDRLWDHPAGPACFEFEIAENHRDYPPLPIRPSAAPASRPTRPSGGP